VQVKRSIRGFALVEILLALLALSILVAIAVMAVANTNGHGVDKSCRTEAHDFDVAVRAFHRDHDNKDWPDDHADGSVQLTADALVRDGSRPSLTHLDGAQRVPSNNNRGWTYDFRTHTTNELGCG
jgi:competence protein ComGC